MSDPFDPPGADPGDPAPPADLSAGLSAEALAVEADAPYPWEAGGEGADDPGAPRQRHDAFTEAKKGVFLRALVKTGCIKDASRLAGISPRTIYRHQEDSPSFFENCRIAIRMSGTPVEITAWQRAVEGSSRNLRSAARCGCAGAMRTGCCACSSRARTRGNTAPAPASSASAS